MTFFKELAIDHHFISADGHRMFFTGVLWSHPYIIPDKDTEERILSRLSIMYFVIFGLILIGLVVPTMLDLEIIRSDAYLLGFILGIWVINWVLRKILPRKEVRDLIHLETKLSVREIYTARAKHFTFSQLIERIVGSLAFTFFGVWFVASDRTPVFGVFCVLFFGLAGVIWSYQLIIKRNLRKSDVLYRKYGA